MYNRYLARYEFLHTTFKEMVENYRTNHYTFKNLCDFYNNVIIKNLIKNDLLINFEFLFLDLKRIPELKVSLSDEILKSQFDFNSEYKKDFKIFACEEYISDRIGRDFLIIHNYLIKNHLMKDKDLQEQLNELQTKHESLIREYCKLMDENRKLKGSYNTHLKGKDYLIMNEFKEDLKMQLKILAVFIIISFLGMIGGMFLVDKTYYSTGIIITLICLWFCVGCIKVTKKDF